MNRCKILSCTTSLIFMFSFSYVTGLLLPVISSNSRFLAMEGKGFQLKCEIKTPRLEVQSTFLSRKGETLRTNEFMLVSDLNADQDSSYLHLKLSITEARKLRDEGDYQCTVTDVYNNTKSTVKAISFTNDPVIELRPLNSVIDSQSFRKKASFLINYFVFPGASFYVYDKVGQLLSDGQRSMKEDKFVVHITDTNILFSIKLPCLDDHGNYTLVATSMGSSTTTTLTLKVSDKPTAVLDDIYVQLGEDAQIACQVSAFPRADMFWSFHPCENLKLWPNCLMAASFDVKQKIDSIQVSETSQVAYINFTSPKPGVLRCHAQNLLGSHSVQRKVEVFDLLKPVMLTRISSEKKAAEGDNVELECGANVYNFMNNFKWSRNDKTIESLDGFKTENRDTNFSWREVFTIENITKADSGIYQCAVKSRNSLVTTSVELVIDVYESESPTIATNFNSTTALSVGDPFKLICKVSGLPLPQLVWNKNGKPFFPAESHQHRIMMSADNSTIDFSMLSPDDEASYKCIAVNRVGSASKCFQLKFPVEVSMMSKVFVAVLLALAILTVCLCCKLRSEKKVVTALKAAGLANFEKGNLECFDLDANVNKQAELLPYDNSFEFPREKLKFGRQLGAGAFGVVIEAIAEGMFEDEETIIVAVKTLRKQNRHEELRALALELKIMIHIGQHLNVVNLLGAVTKNIAKRELMVVVEYCRFGSLKSFLEINRKYFINQIRDERIDFAFENLKVDFSERRFNDMTSEISEGNCKSNYYKNLRGRHYYNVADTCLKTLQQHQRSVCTVDLLLWSIQVAQGMDFLASKKVLHGDLAARNVLLADRNVVKICDFGLSRSLYDQNNYKKESSAPLPFKWLALESLSDHVFSMHSDVWSYGVLLWELFSLGMTPYPGMQAGPELFRNLRNGYRMSKPSFSNQDIYEIMLKCWHRFPELRPSFKELAQWYQKILNEAFINICDDSKAPQMIVNNNYYQGGL